ncbi:MAG: helix-turn-helix domain-containing protein [Syntrophobacteraceae bacterium]
MKKRYPIRLTHVERAELQRLLQNGPRLARVMTRIRILLLADAGKNDREIARSLKVSSTTVHNVRKRYFSERSASSLEERPRPGQPCRLNGNTASRVAGLVRSEPPKGHKRWTLRLLADRAVKLHVIDTISHESVRKILKTS